MNDDKNNDKNENLTSPSPVQEKSCEKCQQNSCVCLQEIDGSSQVKTADETAEMLDKEETSTKKKRPKISWL